MKDSFEIGKIQLYETNKELYTIEFALWCQENGYAIYIDNGNTFTYVIGVNVVCGC